MKKLIKKQKERLDENLIAHGIPVTVVFQSINKDECFKFLDDNPLANAFVEKDAFSNYFKVLDPGLSSGGES